MNLKLNFYSKKIELFDNKQPIMFSVINTVHNEFSIGSFRNIKVQILNFKESKIVDLIGLNHRKKNQSKL